MSALLDAVLAQHRLIAKTRCGAFSIPVIHRHSSESATAGALRVLRCSQNAGHDGPHKDAVCCYNFQEFQDWQVRGRRPGTFDSCSCGQSWPCDTIIALQAADRAAAEVASPA